MVNILYGTNYNHQTKRYEDGHDNRASSGEGGDIGQRIQHLEDEVRALKTAQRDFLTTRIEERDLRIEGTLGIRTVRILSGAGVPAMNAPTGSIYLRNNGTTSNTLYVREAGVWRRVATSAV